MSDTLNHAAAGAIKARDAYIAELEQRLADLRAQLAQQGQEPVAWMVDFTRAGSSAVDRAFYWRYEPLVAAHVAAGDKVTPLYAAPASAQPAQLKCANCENPRCLGCLDPDELANRLLGPARSDMPESWQERLYRVMPESRGYPTGILHDVGAAFKDEEIAEWRALAAPQPAARVAVPEGWQKAEIYTLRRLIECAQKLDERPRPMCRDCADEAGTCPNSGLECDMPKLFAAAKALHNKLAATVTEPAAPADKIEEIRALLQEAYGFASTSPRGQENINAALDLLDEINAAPEDDQEWDRNAERLTSEMGLGGGKINPDATSILDLFVDDDAPAAQQAAQSDSIDWIYSITRDVGELDYDSPEDQPDLLQVTTDELFTIVRRHAPSGRAAGMVGQDAKDAALVEIGKLVATQDNRYTEAPIFVVEQKTPVVSDSDYTDCRVEWRETENGDYQLASPERADRLEALHRAGRDTPGWRRYEMTDIWTFVTACFTEQGCVDYIARNGHNLRETRIYAYGSYRNEEFRTIRKALMSMATQQAQASAKGEQA